MKRLTHERVNGVKTGYWSPEKKETLVNALAEYENTGLTPEEIKMLNGKGADAPANDAWIPVEERLPEDDHYILLSFANFNLPMVGRYETDQEGGTFYLGDCDEEDTCISQDLFVNAWRPLPKPYRPEKEEGRVK